MPIYMDWPFLFYRLSPRTNYVSIPMNISYLLCHLTLEAGVDRFLPWQLDFVVAQTGPRPAVNFLHVR